MLSISACGIVLSCGALFSLAAPFPSSGQTAQPQPQAAEIPVGGAARPERVHPEAAQDSSAMCGCPPQAEGHCDGISQTLVIFDASTSMAERCETGGLRKLEIAQWVLSDIVDAVPIQHPVGILALENTVSVMKPLEPLTGEGKSKLRRAAMERQPIGKATLKQGLNAVHELLKAQDDKSRLVSIVILTDGITCKPAEALPALEELARQHRIRCDVLGIGCDRTHHDELRTLARAANGRFDLVCSTKDLPQALMGIRRDYDDIWKCSLSEQARCRQDLDHCCSEQSRLRNQLKQTQEELSEARKERSELILKLKTINDIEKTVNQIDARSSQTLVELATISEQIRTCDEKIQWLEELVQRVGEQSASIDVNVKKILKKLEDWPPVTEKCDPKLIADELYRRMQFPVGMLLMLLIGLVLLVLATLLRLGSDLRQQRPETQNAPEPRSRNPYVPASNPAHPTHGSTPLESSCPPKSTAPPAGSSKYLGAGRHPPTHPPAAGGPPTDYMP